ncbi:MAG: Nif3-like dinuclear metal center hexameric protein [Mycoplasma sp.]|nr:Nif3-like dinuclear metal center hexameric protein [Mycoplasma sp.]
MKKINQNDIVKFLEEKFPLKNAEKWDFPGFSLKLSNKIVKRVLVCLDVNLTVVEKATKEKIDFIISYHPFKFANSWNTIYVYDKSKKELVKKLTDNKISVYSVHTNLDHDKYGTAYQIIKQLELENNIAKNYNSSIVISYGKQLLDLIVLIKYKLKINTLLTNSFSKLDMMIDRFTLFPGAGDVYQYLDRMKKDKTDLLITSDIKWNEQQLLNSLGVNFIIIPHKTEEIVVDLLGDLLTKNFDDEIKVIKYMEEDFIKGF